MAKLISTSVKPSGQTAPGSYFRGLVLQCPATMPTFLAGGLVGVGVGEGGIWVAVGVPVGVGVAVTGVGPGGHDGCTTTAIMAKALTTITASSILWVASSAPLLTNSLSPPGGARLLGNRLYSIIPLIFNLVNSADGWLALLICAYQAFVVNLPVFAMEITGVVSMLHHRRI
jgi:hypothetical protein